MTEHEVVEQSRLRELAQWLTTWAWPLTESASVDLAAKFGWTVIDEDPGKGEIFDTGLLTTRSWSMSSVKNGEVYRLSIFTSSVVDGETPVGQKYVSDVFATQVQTVTEVIGEPAVAETGVDSFAEWQLVKGATLRVGRTDGSCSWTVDSPYFAQLKADVSKYEDETSSRTELPEHFSRR